MGRGFQIGRLFGIKIRIDWSWLAILGLTIWNLGSVFGNFHPDWGPALQWGIAVAAALLFFASVLAHELAHSLVARAQGVPVRSITLFLFGGVSDIQREPESPGNEFLMAILGPVTSLVIGGVLLLLSGFLVGMEDVTLTDPGENLIAQLGPLATLVVWLGSVNILVGLFNLIPGFPLDGGRVLRSILWAVTDNLYRATRWASWVGQGIAWLMMIAGVAMAFGVRIPFFGEGLLSGLWLVFIGLFLNNAASQSYQRLVIQDILEDVPVGNLMRENPPTCSPGCSVDDLVHDHIMGSDDQGFPVMEGGQLVGLVTLEDVREVPREAWQRTTVGEIMTPFDELVTTTVDEDAADALTKLSGRDVRQLPVLSDGNQLAGLLRRQDIIRWLQLNSELE